jgi:hypothetical protein
VRRESDQEQQGEGVHGEAGAGRSLAFARMTDNHLAMVPVPGA